MVATIRTAMEEGTPPEKRAVALKAWPTQMKSPRRPKRIEPLVDSASLVDEEVGGAQHNPEEQSELGDAFDILFGMSDETDRESGSTSSASVSSGATRTTTATSHKLATNKVASASSRCSQRRPSVQDGVIETAILGLMDPATEIYEESFGDKSLFQVRSRP